jgi:uncharacterized protein DUF4265
MSSNPVKVHFRLEQDEDGYPPTDSEFLWCIPTERGTYVVDNIPFFARDISLADEVSAEKKGKILHFLQLVKQSSNTTVRVLIKRMEALDVIRERLETLGCGTELMQDMSLLAVTIPPESPIAETLSFLDGQAEQGNIGIEESAVRYQLEQ